MDPLIGEIIMFAGNFPPRGWAFCDGQLLDINSHSALFSILGTTYGGDGRTTFALPDLRSRVPIHEGHGPGLSNYRLGQKSGGENAVGAITGQVSVAIASTSGEVGPVSRTGNSVAVTTVNTPATGQIINGRGEMSTIQPHLAVNFIIAMEGVYPSRS